MEFLSELANDLRKGLALLSEIANVRYEVNDTNRKEILKAHLVAFGIGIIFLVAALLCGVKGPIKRLMMDSKIEAYDIDVYSTKEENSEGEEYFVYIPTYYYMVDGRTYRHKVEDGTTNRKRIYKRDMIYYDSTESDQCVSELEVQENMLMFILFGLSTAYIFIVDAVSLVMVFKDNKSLVGRIRYKKR